MRMSPQKRNVLRRLRRAVKPILYPCGIVDESEPDGCMRLYMFQHEHERGDPRRRTSRKIADDYMDARYAGPNYGDPINEFYGFAADGIVDDVCIAITIYPYRRLSLRTLRRLLAMVERIAAKKAAAAEAEACLATTDPSESP